MRSLTVLSLAVVSLALPPAAGAQLPHPALVLGRYDGPPIEARQATPEEVGRLAVPCPMLLDLSLATHGGNGSFKGLDVRLPDLIVETAAFTCDRARVDMIQIERSNLPGKVQLRLLPTLAPELPGRTVDLTVAFVVDGAEVRSRSARLDTRGVASGGQVVSRLEPRSTFDFEFSDQEFASMFGAGRSPVLRIILDV